MSNERSKAGIVRGRCAMLAALGLVCLMAMPGAYASSVPSSGNLLTNGDFEAGNTGFLTSFGYSPGNIWGEGTYDIVANPRSSHSAAASYGDHTTGSGLMMAINGSTTGATLMWSETVAIVAGQTYDFDFWHSTWHLPPSGIGVSINGTQIGALNAPTTPAAWEQFSAQWFSGSATSATIELFNTTNEYGGNDLALDDLFFGTIGNPVPEPASMTLLGLGLAGLAVRRRRNRR